MKVKRFGFGGRKVGGFRWMKVKRFALGGEKGWWFLMNEISQKQSREKKL